MSDSRLEENLKEMMIAAEMNLQEYADFRSKYDRFVRDWSEELFMFVVEKERWGKFRDLPEEKQEDYSQGSSISPEAVPEIQKSETPTETYSTEALEQESEKSELLTTVSQAEPPIEPYSSDTIKDTEDDLPLKVLPGSNPKYVLSFVSAINYAIKNAPNRDPIDLVSHTFPHKVVGDSYFYSINDLKETIEFAKEMDFYPARDRSLEGVRGPR